MEMFLKNKNWNKKYENMAGYEKDFRECANTSTNLRSKGS
jgi:hypothetical protein